MLIYIRKGSIQSITRIPSTIRRIYKNAHELDQYKLIDLAAGRGPYICQSQTLTLFGKRSEADKLVISH